MPFVSKGIPPLVRLSVVCYAYHAFFAGRKYAVGDKGKPSRKSMPAEQQKKKTSDKNQMFSYLSPLYGGFFVCYNGDKSKHKR